MSEPSTARTEHHRDPGARRAPSGEQLVVDTIAEHAPSLLATARRYSICADDAQDAYQRALEIFLRHADNVRPDTAAAWLRTVIKHEALAVRAARTKLVGPGEADLDLHEARELPPADERAGAFEELERCAEALSRLKPQEIRALVLKAHGYSYEEICQLTGWTYTKVNRCLTEGRRALRARVADIDAGRECERWSGLLSAVADGEASADEVLALRPHLRGCPACRATLREYRIANRGVAAVVPLAALADPATAAEAAPGLAVRIYEVLTGGVPDRALASAQRLHAGIEAASVGKLAAVAASATALAGSGVAVVQRSVAPPARSDAVALRDGTDRERRGAGRSRIDGPRDAARGRRGEKRDERDEPQHDADGAGDREGEFGPGGPGAGAADGSAVRDIPQGGLSSREEPSTVDRDADRASVSSAGDFEPAPSPGPGRSAASEFGP